MDSRNKCVCCVFHRMSVPIDGSAHVVLLTNVSDCYTQITETPVLQVARILILSLPKYANHLYNDHLNISTHKAGDKCIFVSLEIKALNKVLCIRSCKIAEL